MELPKQLGGLGIGSILNKNIALMFKWLWRYFEEPHALWRLVIDEKYGYPSFITFPDLSPPLNGGPWRVVCTTIFKHPVAESFGLENFDKQIGNEAHTMFWQDLWVCDCPL